MAAAQALLLTLLSNGYGFHRDELYFLVAGKHLAWGYVDQPPLTPFIARASTTIFGQSPAGLRVAATLCGMTAALLAALIARELGGGRAAQVFTAIATALSGFIVAISHILATASIDAVVWVALAWLALRLLRTGERRWWIAIGAVVAVGMANKWLVPLLAVALVAAVLLVGPRRVLVGRWPLIGLATMAVLIAPVVVWQARNGWPLLTVAGGISSKDGASNRALFVPDQLLLISPVLVPTLAAGWWRLWHEPAMRWARALPVGYLILCVELLVAGGKPYYPVPVLVVFLAAGADGTLRTLRRMSAAARAGGATLFAVGATVSLVVGLPILPPQDLNGPVLAINKEQGAQVGWPNLAAATASVWQQIPAAQRGKAVVFAQNYGEAGAIAFYGPADGLPQPYSGHMSFYTWGPPSDAMNGPVVVILEPKYASNLLGHFTGCQVEATENNGYGLKNEEQKTQVWLCDGPTRPWSHLWPSLREYY